MGFGEPMKRVVGWFVLVPLCALVILFTLANRQSVAVYLSPFGENGPFLPQFNIPLFLLIYAVLIIGIFMGGLAVWFTQGRNRRERRRLKRETARLEKELETARKTMRKTGTAPAVLDPEDLLDDA